MRSSITRYICVLIVRIGIVCSALGPGLSYGGRSSDSFDQVSEQEQAQQTPTPTLLVNYGHDDEVVELAVSPDGKYLLSGGANGTLCVWEVASGRFLYSLNGFVTGGKAQALAFSPDGRSFAGVLASSADLMWDSVNRRQLYYTRVPGWHPSIVGVWEIATGRQLYRLEGHQHTISFLSFTPDSKQLISAEHGDIRRWDLHNPNIAVWYKLRHDSEELELFWQLKGLPIPNPYWTTLSSDGSTQTLSRTMGDRVTTHHKWVWGGGALFCRTAMRVAVLNKGTLAVFDVVSKRRLLGLHLRKTATFAFAMSPDGNRVAVGYRDGSIDVIDTNSGRVMSRNKIHWRAVSFLAFSPDSTALFSGGFDQIVRRWVLTTGQIDTYPQRTLSQNTMIASNEDNTLLALGTEDGDVYVWDLIAGQLKYSFPSQSKECRSNVTSSCTGSQVIGLHFSHKHESLTSVGRNGSLNTWNMQTGQLARSHEVGGTIEFVDFKGDELIALCVRVDWYSSPSTINDSRESVRLLDAYTLQTILVQTLEGFPRGAVLVLKFAADEEAILVWTPLGFWAVMFDGTLEYRGTAFNVRSSGVMAVAPNGNFIASALRDGTIAIHRSNSMEYSRVLSGTSSDVNHLVFSHAGDRILSSNSSRTVTLWNSYKFTQLYTHEFEAGNHPAIFSQNDRQIMLIGNHSVSEIYNTDSGELLASLAMYRDGEWVIWTPDLFYNASDAGELDLVTYTATGIRPLFELNWMWQPEVIQQVLTSIF